MEATITKSEKQPLLKRTHVTLHVVFEGATVSRADLKKGMAKLVSAPAERVVIRHIEPQFGRQSADASIYVYDDPETLARVESTRVRERNGLIAKAEAQVAKEEA